MSSPIIIALGIYWFFAGLTLYQALPMAVKNIKEVLIKFVCSFLLGGIAIPLRVLVRMLQ